MIAFARAAVLAILRQHGLTKSGTAAQQNPRHRPGISNRIAAALDGKPVDEDRPLALDSSSSG
jgi:hypothetical protein